MKKNWRSIMAFILGIIACIIAIAYCLSSWITHTDIGYYGTSWLSLLGAVATMILFIYLLYKEFKGEE